MGHDSPARCPAVTVSVPRSDGLVALPQYVGARASRGGPDDDGGDGHGQGDWFRPARSRPRRGMTTFHRGTSKNTCMAERRSRHVSAIGGGREWRSLDQSGPRRTPRRRNDSHPRGAVLGVGDSRDSRDWYTIRCPPLMLQLLQRLDLRGPGRSVRAPRPPRHRSPHMDGLSHARGLPPPRQSSRLVYPGSESFRIP